MCKGVNSKFTLIELLVLVSIIAILASMLLPSLSKARYKAKEAACLSNMKQCHLSAIIYAKDNSGNTPFVTASDQPDCFKNNNPGILAMDSYSSGFGTWKCAVLPFVENIDDPANSASKGRSSFSYYPGRTYLGSNNTPLNLARQNPDNLFLQDLWYQWNSSFRTNHSYGGEFKKPYPNNPSFATHFGGTIRSLNAIWADGHGRNYTGNSGTMMGSSLSNNYYGISKP